MILLPINVTSVFLLTWWAKNASNWTWLPLVAFFCPEVNSQIHVSNWPFCMGKLVPSVFCPVNHFTVLALYLLPLSAHALPSLSHRSVEKSEQSACYVVSDELNVMFAIHVLFLYRLSGLLDCFCNKRFLSCRFHFQVYQTDVLVSYTWKINKNIVTELVYLVHS